LRADTSQLGRARFILLTLACVCAWRVTQCALECIFRKLDGYNMHEMEDMRTPRTKGDDMRVVYGDLFVEGGSNNMSPRSPSTPRTIRRKVPFLRRFWRRLRRVFPACSPSTTAATT
jgi:hypothetical protein